MNGTMIVRDIPINSIMLTDNDRSQYTGIEELAASIDENGLIHPVTSRPLPSGQYELVAGYRRYWAFVYLKRDTIPSHIEEYDDRQAARIMWIENDTRSALDPMDESVALKKRLDSFNISINQLADEVGRSAGWVRDRLALLQLVDQAKHLVSVGQLRVGYALAMAPLDANRQSIVLQALAGSKSLNQFRQLCGKLQADQAQEILFDWHRFMTEAVNVEEDRKERASSRKFPIADHLPAFMPIKGVGLSIETYIADLLAAGLHGEAAVVGRVYSGLLESGNAFRPIKSPLDKDHD